MTRFSSPIFLYKIMQRAVPWLGLLSCVLFSYALCAALYFAPDDYQQKEAVKLMYVHVPAALLSLSIYTIIGINSAVYLIWRVKVADVIAKVSAPFGATVTGLALFTGALWGKPMWGTWWVWDARLTSELILLFLYFGYISLRAAITDRHTSATACAVLAVVGLIDIPIIHYSVQWWNTLHQGASISRLAKPAIAPEMLYPLLAMLLAFYTFYALILCLNFQSEILWRERNCAWVHNLLIGVNHVK